MHRTTLAAVLFLSATPAAAQPLVGDLSGLVLELPARDQPRPWLTVATAAALGGHVADLTSTLIALRDANLYEANPTMAWASQHPAALTALKMGGAVLLNWWLWQRADSHPRLIRWIMVAQTVGFGSLAIRNARVTR